MAFRIASEGLVTVSLRKSTIGSAIDPYSPVIDSQSRALLRPA
jgi:hypothetical protein